MLNWNALVIMLHSCLEFNRPTKYTTKQPLHWKTGKMSRRFLRLADSLLESTRLLITNDKPNEDLERQVGPYRYAYWSVLFYFRRWVHLNFFSRVLCDSTPRFVDPLVRWSVGSSVGPSHFTFFWFLRSLASHFLPKWSSDLKNSPCPPARDWGSRVSGLV